MTRSSPAAGAAAQRGSIAEAQASSTAASDCTSEAPQETVLNGEEPLSPAQPSTEHSAPCPTTSRLHYNDGCKTKTTPGRSLDRANSCAQAEGAAAGTLEHHNLLQELQDAPERILKYLRERGTDTPQVNVEFRVFFGPAWRWSTLSITLRTDITAAQLKATMMREFTNMLHAL